MAEVLVKHLVKRFGNVVAVDDVSLRIVDGEFLVLLGPSGCGKSTILRVVAGLEDATSGEIVIGDRLVNFVDPVKRNVAMVFQNYALYPHMTVYKNIAFPLTMAKKTKGEIESAVDRAARMLGLANLLERHPGQLSGGQRQRVALARAIVREPQAFLMDEPLSNLDAQLRVQTRLELIQLHERLGITTIYVTHDQVEAMTMGHRIAVMSEGVLQQVGTPQEVYRRPANVFVATFLGAADQGHAAGAPVRFGLRPEHFQVGPPGGDGAIEGRVHFLEPVGSDLYLTVEIGEATLQVRTDPDSPLQPGENVSLAFDPWRAHVFGADGENLRRDSTPVEDDMGLSRAAT
jgi:multiple sugar transport system ATP-binding protein